MNDIIKNILEFKKMHLIENDNKFIRHIQDALYNNKEQKEILPQNIENMLNQSAVLLPVGRQFNRNDHSSGPSSELGLILNKRSKNVRQAGDLCCPGGSVSFRFDAFLSKLLTFPFTSLTRWKFWSKCLSDSPKDALKLSVLYATSLRESFEEMRLNPFGVRFMGVLPAQQLATRQTYIFPMVGWIPRQKKFFPNWEVEKIVYISFRNLLDPKNYAVFRMNFHAEEKNQSIFNSQLYPCYLHQSQNETDLLWGATYRIVLDFLHIIFKFKPPDEKSLPIIDWQLDKHYFGNNGS